MVQVLNGISRRENADRSEIPVIIPGKAMGRITSSEMVSRPKNLDRATAAAVSVPRISARTVEIAATLTDSAMASQTSLRPNVTPIHFVVKPGGGH